jgi:arylsulfatase A-like enzyme
MMIRSVAILLLAICSPLLGAQERPNILWLTSEDNSPYLGCYGDPQAKTPNLDRLAMQGIRYRNAFSSAPVCSAARSTLITGMNACTLGIHNHRSRVKVPASVVYYNQLFREAGYYCTNNSKTDYNCVLPGGGKKSSPAKFWNESSKKAHYQNRKKGQPFFAVFNTTLSHEGQTTDKAYHGRRKQNPAQRIVPPGKVILPPYHPDTPVIRENWSRYFDNLWLMDKWVGDKLKELDALGDAENTIVFYYGDHGGALPRGKRNIHDSGTRVPLIIRFPEKWKHLATAKPGEWIDDPVAFVDFPATAANLCGIEIPKIWEGTPFAGPNAVKQEFVYLFRGRMDERYDTVRAIRSKDYLYVKNFSPHRPYGQAYTYPFRVLASMGSWYDAFKAGKCNEVQARYWKPKAAEEFYVIKDDPNQTNNLIDDPKHAERVKSMRNQLMVRFTTTKDTGLIPEGMYSRLAGDGTVYEYAQGATNEAVLAAMLATSRDRSALKALMKMCSSDSGLARYWAATGGLILGKEAAPMRAELLGLLEDPVLDVRAMAAEALGHLGEAEKATPVLIDIIRRGNTHESLAAITALEAFGRSGVLPMEKVRALIPKEMQGDSNRVVEAIDKIK